MKTLHELLAGLDVEQPVGEGASTLVRDITEDSRSVTPGSLFVARRGAAHDGRRFIEDAVARGACAVVIEKDEASGRDVNDINAAVPMLRTRSIAQTTAAIAERFFDHPSRKLKIVGVTGTNGKTTVATLTRQLLAHSGVRCGLVGTIEIDDGHGRCAASLTTPFAIELSRSLSHMVDAGCEAAAIEASSHALDQGRVDAIEFDVGVFTNLSGDHLDYHGSMERYAAAKSKLFASLDSEGAAIVNRDDASAPMMEANCRAPVTTCTVRDGVDAVCRGLSRSSSIAGMDIELRGAWGTINAHTKLFGEHALMNLLEAAAAAHAMGVDAAVMERAIPALESPPGRLELITLDGDDDPSLRVVVDFAHTDEALERALAALRPLTPEGGRLCVVFGCGGDRDRTKRPRMGAVAVAMADVVCVTSDNPRTEAPGAIIAQILAGMPVNARSHVQVEPDRVRAIAGVIRDAEPGDIVLIAGKGHETTQIVSDGEGGTIRLPMDDRLLAREALRRRAGMGVRAPGVSAEGRAHREGGLS